LIQIRWLSVDMGAEDPVGRLRAAELRVTAPRVQVLKALDRLHHPDVDTIATAVREEIGTVSTQAVYDVLRAFDDVGLVRRIEPAGHSARFETRVGDNHHHLICRSCGRIEDVDCAEGEAPCLFPDDAAGFVLDEAEVTYWGLCPDCHRKTATTA
jgi:Fe2+ or Zn2+ uptake regulation protein